MSLDPDRVEQVARQIGSAFSEVCFPGNKQLLHPKCLDDMEVNAFRNGDRWQDIPERLIAVENATLSFVSAEGFQYLIPAYMIWTLKYFEDGDISVDSTIFALDPGNRVTSCTIFGFPNMCCSRRLSGRRSSRSWM